MSRFLCPLKTSTSRISAKWPSTFSAVACGTRRIFCMYEPARGASKSLEMEVSARGSCTRSSGTKGPKTIRPMTSPSYSTGCTT